MTKTAFLQKYRIEIDNIVDALSKYNDQRIIEALKRSQKNPKSNNPKRWVSYLYNICETNIMNIARDYLATSNICISSSIHDGCIVEFDKTQGTTELTNLTDGLHAEIKSKIGWDITFKIKTFDKMTLTPKQFEQNDCEKIWNDIAEWSSGSRMFRYNDAVYKRNDMRTYDVVFVCSLDASFVDIVLPMWAQHNMETEVYSLYIKNRVKYNAYILSVLRLPHKTFPLEAQKTKMEQLRYFGYNNGVYDIVKQEFIATPDESIVARNCFPLDFTPEDGMDNAIEYMNTHHPELLKIMRDQRWEDRTVVTALAMMGRMLFPISHTNPVESKGRNEGLMTLLTGEGGTGKSTLTDSIRHIVGESKVFKVNTKEKHVTKYNDLRSKDAIVIDDTLGQDWAGHFPEEEFKQIVNGEYLSTRQVCKASTDKDTFEVETPMIAAHNYAINYPPSGAISRRVVCFKFSNQIDAVDKSSTLPEIIKSKAPSLVPFIVYQYTKLFSSLGSSSFWKHIEEHVPQMNAWRLPDSRSDTLTEFIETYCKHEAGCVMTFKEFKNAYWLTLKNNPAYKNAPDNLIDYHILESRLLKWNSKIQCYNECYLCAASMSNMKRSYGFRMGSIPSDPTVPHKHAKGCCDNHIDGTLKNARQRPRGNSALFVNLTLDDPDWE